MTPARTTAWKLSSSLKRAQLQSIATSIGAPISGTKTQLLDGINELLTQAPSKHGASPKNDKTSPQELRVLSIDMGIRNLAFAFLTCQTHSSSPASIRKSTTTIPAPIYTKPELKAWQRIDLFNVSQAFPSPSPSPSTTNPSPLEPTIAAPESFDPPTLATHAYTFAHHCTTLSPTHILIERQRFRTAGHAAVLEWSLRVGMLESMLHSTFHTLRQTEILPDVVIEPVLPMRVNKFWFADHPRGSSVDDVAEEKGGKGAKAAKMAKIGIVGGMLEGLDGAPFVVGEGARGTVEAFRREVDRKPGGRRGLQGGTGLEKLDDVADSLLQGLAWLRWRENRERLATGDTDEGITAALNGKETGAVKKSRTRKKKSKE